MEMTTSLNTSDPAHARVRAALRGEGGGIASLRVYMLGDDMWKEAEKRFGGMLIDAAKGFLPHTRAISPASYLHYAYLLSISCFQGSFFTI